MSGLRAAGLHAGWDGDDTLRGLDLRVGSGEGVAVLGGNGSGKSTLLAVLAGLLRPRRGQQRLGGRRVDGFPAHRLARHGVRLLPQTRRVFGSMTVAENLAIAEHRVARGEVTAMWAAHARWLATFPALAAAADQRAANLSGGQQQLLAIVRVLTWAPRVLLLDEPFAGLTTSAVTNVTTGIAELACGGTAVVLVEQNQSLAYQIVDRVFLLREGTLHATPGHDLTRPKTIRPGMTRHSMFGLTITEEGQPWTST